MTIEVDMSKVVRPPQWKVRIGGDSPSVKELLKEATDYLKTVS